MRLLAPQFIDEGLPIIVDIGSVFNDVGFGMAESEQPVRVRRIEGTNRLDNIKLISSESWQRLESLDPVRLAPLHTILKASVTTGEQIDPFVSEKAMSGWFGEARLEPRNDRMLQGTKSMSFRERRLAMGCNEAHAEESRPDATMRSYRVWLPGAAPDDQRP